MNGDVVIAVSGLSKRYVLNSARASYGSMRDSFGALLGRLARPGERQPAPEPFWALKDVSFEVRRGEVLGVIGRNGAGKSTLLKILSRITPPTEGRIEIRGRVGTLLEVGTGFHPELSGRENIYMNGAILGMTRAEITRKFDEIVTFAEIERFLDTPVKRYSSGMYVRLAFAVAAHLEAEILLSDEVLAVGDLEFQKKCMGKMSAVAKAGRTVLFVSHNMGVVSRLCPKAILLHGGRLEKYGAVEDVVCAYLAATSSAKEGERTWSENDAPGDETVRLRAVRITDEAGVPAGVFDIRKPVFVEIEYEVRRPTNHLRMAYRLAGGDGTLIFTAADTNNPEWNGKLRAPGMYVSRCAIPANFLNEGEYGLQSVAADFPFQKIAFFEENVMRFHVAQTGGLSGQYPEKWPGVICPSLPWTVRRAPDGERDRTQEGSA
jgi:lipopolysaccharide transport system ATP-binding protein